MTKSWVARFFGFPHLEFLRHSTFVLRHSIRIRTTKVFPGELPGKTFAKRTRPTTLRGGRRHSRRFRCCSGRFCCRCRTGCFSCCRRTRGRRSCRGLSCLGLLLARREKRGTGQNTDVFFHSVDWKRHIALTVQSEQGSF